MQRAGIVSPEVDLPVAAETHGEVGVNVTEAPAESLVGVGLAPAGPHPPAVEHVGVVATENTNLTDSGYVTWTFTYEELNASALNVNLMAKGGVGALRRDVRGRRHR